MGERIIKLPHVIATALIASCLLAGNASAGSQGTLGNNSTGSLNFSVTKPARADISNLTDLRLPSWIIGDGAVKLSEDVCVYSTRPSGGYTVLATGSDAGGAFGLSNGSHTIAYTVNWNDGGAGSLSDSGDDLTATQVSGPMTHAATDSSSCSGTNPGPTARLVIRISNAQMTAAPAGTFLGILTLMITPN